MTKRLRERKRKSGAPLKVVDAEVEVKAEGEFEQDEDESEADGGSDEAPSANSNAGGNGTGDGTDAGDAGDAAKSGEEKPDSSVVALKFKKRYMEHAREAGIKGKAARRSNWDWLAQIIAAECLEKDKIDIERFMALLKVNGVDPTKWPNRSRGWEGRLRMTGRVALQRIVADAKELKLTDGEVKSPPAEFIEKYKSK